MNNDNSNNNNLYELTIATEVARVAYSDMSCEESKCETAMDIINGMRRNTYLSNMDNEIGEGIALSMVWNAIHRLRKDDSFTLLPELEKKIDEVSLYCLDRKSALRK